MPHNLISATLAKESPNVILLTVTVESTFDHDPNVELL
jgi:hypothetical protein